MEEALAGTSLVDIPRLDQPMDENWTTVEGDWVMANVSTISHLGTFSISLKQSRECEGAGVLRIGTLLYSMDRNLDFSKAFERLVMRESTESLKFMLSLFYNGLLTTRPTL